MNLKGLGQFVNSISNDNLEGRFHSFMRRSQATPPKIKTKFMAEAIPKRSVQ